MTVIFIVYIFIFLIITIIAYKKYYDMLKDIENIKNAYNKAVSKYFIQLNKGTQNEKRLL